jgi:hypothetical protein
MIHKDIKINKQTHIHTHRKVHRYALDNLWNREKIKSRRTSITKCNLNLVHAILCSVHCNSSENNSMQNKILQTSHVVNHSMYVIDNYTY